MSTATVFDTMFFSGGWGVYERVRAFLLASVGLCCKVTCNEREKEAWTSSDLIQGEN